MYSDCIIHKYTSQIKRCEPEDVVGASRLLRVRVKSGSHIPLLCGAASLLLPFGPAMRSIFLLFYFRIELGF
ncbi:hypothetical protein N665_0447s0018 [Sinapis alba]|nr:hypothetical protein N665_0447s0018 [Sinapis alba]